MSIVKLNNRGVRSVTAFGSLSSGSITFIKKLTASSSASLSFVDGSSDVVLDNTYKEYLFTFKNIHMATDSDDLGWQANAASESGYNETVTSSAFTPYHQENGGSGQAVYNVGSDQAQGTGIVQLTQNQGNSADNNAGGFLHLFNPSDTTFVKHFISSLSYDHATVAPAAVSLFAAGYVNTTSAINDIKFFTRSGGNIDAGDICLYGIN